MRSDPVDVSGGKEIRRVAEIFNTVTDERDEVLISLAEREAFFRSLTQRAPIGIVQTDILGRIEFANPAFESIVDRPAEELTFNYLANRIHEADREEERLSWEATHDSLTQLLNRRAFNASLVRCLGEAGRQEVRSVLMLIDLDYFKPVNDEGGHLLGDDLLKRLADLFKDSVRQSDTVARLGGDEFGIILPACGIKRAQALAERIRADVEALRIEHDGRSFGVTTSIGLTELTPQDSGPREVMARADEGSYVAKSRGRNRVVVVPSPPAG